MHNYIWLDVLDVGRKIGVPERTFIPPIPGETRMVTEQSWNEDFLQQAIREVSSYKEMGGTVVITGHADVWVILGIGYSLRPECNLMFGASMYGPDSPAVATPLLELATGSKNPELRFDYNMHVDGDNCYLDYCTDDPDAPPGVVHTFENKSLPNLILPEIPQGKNLFLHAKASYYVQVNVTNSYIHHAKTISTSYHDSSYYHCAYSSVPEMKVGFATPRKVGV